MNATLTQPTVTRRILWVDDNPKDIQGYREYLQFLGHVVVPAVDFEGAADKLRTEPFDLFVVDQHLPRGRRKLHEAGSQLVQGLKQGSYGALNATTPFVFVTASADWVLNGTIDVVPLKGYLGIEEKGDDLTGWFEDHLPTLPARTADAPAAGATGTRDADRPTVGAPTTVRAEVWRGVVLEVLDSGFRARLADAEDRHPDHEILFPADIVGKSVRHRLAPSIEFSWTVSLIEASDGSRSTVSRFDLMPRTGVTEADVARALKRARSRRQP